MIFSCLQGWAFLWVFGVCAALVAQVNATTLSGEIEGARYVVRLPTAPIGNVLLIAHGYWPEGTSLDADIAWASEFTEELVEAGWIVGFTTYRRSGWIMEEAEQDMENLYEIAFAASHGKLGNVYVMGDSMGGGVATRLAENPGNRFKGVLAMGAYLYGPIGEAPEGSQELGRHFSIEPKIPILYLTNTSELAGPQAYAEAAARAPVPPALWSVNRSGHVNVNRAEERAALMALVEWVQSGEIERRRDGTIEMNPASTATLAATEATAKGIASRVVPIYGNFIASFVRSDFNTLKIQKGDAFELTAAGKTVPVLLGETYADVPVGEWVAFWDAEGHLLISRNYENGAETLGITVGAELVVKALK